MNRTIVLSILIHIAILSLIVLFNMCLKKHNEKKYTVCYAIFLFIYILMNVKISVVLSIKNLKEALLQINYIMACTVKTNDIHSLIHTLMINLNVLPCYCINSIKSLGISFKITYSFIVSVICTIKLNITKILSFILVIKLTINNLIKYFTKENLSLFQVYRC